MTETRGARLGAEHDIPAAGEAGRSPMSVHSLSTGSWRMPAGGGQRTASDPRRAQGGAGRLYVEQIYAIETNKKEYMCYALNKGPAHMRSVVSPMGLARKQLERRLAPLRKAPEFARPARGWVKAVREALGMTAAQLGGRIGVSQSRIARIEKDEAEDAVTLATLRRVAEGLDCTLVYALVPNRPLDEILAERARAQADAQLKRTHHSMRLENQALDKSDLEDQRSALVEALVAGDPRRLWDAS